MHFHPEFKVMDCPFTRKKVVLVPALAPNVSIIHAPYADAMGNVKLEGPYTTDILLAKASDKTIVTAEKVISKEEMKERGPTIPYLHVTKVVEVPYGAHPTSCYPIYAYDREHISEYIEVARQNAEIFQRDYLDRYVFGVDEHQDYLELIGGKARLERLHSWKESEEKWKEVFSYGAS